VSVEVGQPGPRRSTVSLEMSDSSLESYAPREHPSRESDARGRGSGPLVGLDLVEIARFSGVLARHPGVVRRCFTARERLECTGRGDPTPHLAARFAAKEATMKALGCGIGAVGFVEIEVVRSDRGAPALELYGRAAERAERLGAGPFSVSLTHTETTAAAVVISS
jgi:holo-[acyl-carrier protein] synthase